MQVRFSPGSLGEAFPAHPVQAKSGGKLGIGGNWPGGNEYAWYGKGPALESDRNCFFFKRQLFRFKAIVGVLH